MAGPRLITGGPRPITGAPRPTTEALHPIIGGPRPTTTCPTSILSSHSLVVRPRPTIIPITRHQTDMLPPLLATTASQVSRRHPVPNRHLSPTAMALPIRRCRGPRPGWPVRRCQITRPTVVVAKLLGRSQHCTLPLLASSNSDIWGAVDHPLPTAVACPE